MQETGIDDLHSYHEYLEVHPEEFANLFDSILINVTDFFRDPAAWEHLSSEVLDQVVKSAGDDATIRVWSAGCSSGQEAYSIAMVLAEHLGEHDFVRRVKIYGTDIDEPALVKARSSVYSAREVSSVSPERLERFFERVSGGYRFDPDLRRRIVFGRLDLTRDAPISRLDMLSCRNTLMYFNAELQALAASRFHYALRDSGILFLGRAETLLSHRDLFESLDGRHRVYRRVSGGMHNRGGSELLRSRMFQPGAASEPILSGSDDTLADRAAAASPVAMLVIGADGVLVGANPAARTQFAITPDDIGQSLSDLEISYRPVELRSMIETAYAQSAPCERHNVERPLDGDRIQYLDVTVAPLPGDSGTPLGVSVTFVDATETVELRAELSRTQEELQTNNEELQSTNEELQTSNEELQSTNEELQTMNEELQSTNEELQTTNEELRSANEQLVSLSGDARVQAERLDREGLLLEAVLEGVDQPVIVLDDRLDVVLWNAAMAELVGHGPHEMLGRSLPSMDVGLALEELVRPMHDAVSGHRSTVETSVRTTTGVARYRVQVSPAALGGERSGVRILLSAIEPS